MFDVAFVEAMQRHLVTLPLCLSFHQLAVVTRDEEMDVVYAAILVQVVHIKYI